MDSSYSLSRIDFIEIQDVYSFNEDLPCKYSLVNYKVQEGDRIAIFKLGWQFVKDYVLFEWVPKCSEENSIVFNKFSLPKSTIEIYQFCYISGENNVLGASEPFQFCDYPKNKMPLFASQKNNFSLADGSSMLSISQTTSHLSVGKEMMQLKEENEFLRNTLKLIIQQKQTKNHNPDIQKIEHSIFQMQTRLNAQQAQIRELQLQITKCHEEQKQLQKEKLGVQLIYEDLKNKLNDPNVSIQEPIDIDVGELESIPPFPFAK